MFRVEWFKAFRKKEVLFLSGLLLFPSLMALILLVSDSYQISYSFGSVIPIFPYSAISYGFIATFGFSQIVFGLLATSTLCDEINSHYVLLYFPRISCRKNCMIPSRLCCF